jgi:hypothetical protein
MSIYDNSFDSEPKKTPKKTPPKKSPSSAVPAKPAEPPPAEATVEESKPTAEAKATGGGDSKKADRPRKRLRSCALGCLGICVISVAICGVSGFIVYKRAPDWAHDAIVAAVNDSDLDPKSKQAVRAQIDRLLKEYKAGNVSNDQLVDALDELGNSPVLVFVLAYTAMEVYVEPSGLSDKEKASAKLAFQRVARGAFDETIDPDELDKALDYISKEDFNGNRQLKNQVSDDELRGLIKECHRAADKAEVPKEPFEVDVVAEVTRIVDRALGILPEEPTEPELDHTEVLTAETEAKTNEGSQDGNSFDGDSSDAVEAAKAATVEG